MLLSGINRAVGLFKLYNLSRFFVCITRGVLKLKIFFGDLKRRVGDLQLELYPVAYPRGG